MRKGVDDGSASKSDPYSVCQVLRIGASEESGTGTTTLIPEESFRQGFYWNNVVLVYDSTGQESLGKRGFTRQVALSESAV